MSTSIIYKELVEVKIIHHYFLNKGTSNYEGMSKTDRDEMMNKYLVNEFFQIVPTQKTQEILYGLKILFKNTAQGFVLLCKVDSSDNDKAFTNLLESIPLTFKIILKDPLFYNYSAITLKNRTGKIYYFSNTNKEDYQYPYLSEIASEFDSSAAADAIADGDPDTYAYYPGDILTDDILSPSVMYEAIKSTNSDVSTATDWRIDVPASEYDNSETYSEGDVVRYTDSGVEAIYEALNETTGNIPTDTSNWEKLRNLPLHYVTSEDLLPVLSSVFNFTLAGPAIDTAFEVLDVNGNTVLSDSVISDELQLIHQLDLRSLKSGVYSIVVTDNSGPTELHNQKYFLLQNLSDLADTFAILEIYMGNNLDSYSLVDSSNNILPQTYEIRFKNRSTVWRYKNQDDETEYQSESNPLTQNGFINETFNGNDLVNPDVNIIKPEAGQYYSEIYLNTTN